MRKIENDDTKRKEEGGRGGRGVVEVKTVSDKGAKFRRREIPA